MNKPVLIELEVNGKIVYSEEVPLIELKMKLKMLTSQGRSSEGNWAVFYRKKSNFHGKITKERVFNQTNINKIFHRVV